MVHVRHLHTFAHRRRRMFYLDVTACDGMSLGEQRSGELSDVCSRIQVAPARAKLHRRLQLELYVAIYILRQVQGADRILRADVHPGELCWRGSKTALRGSRYSWLATNSCNMIRAQRHYSYI